MMKIIETFKHGLLLIQHYHCNKTYALLVCSRLWDIVETVVLLCQKAEEAKRHIEVSYEPLGRHMKTTNSKR